MTQSHVSVPVPTALFVELVNFLGEEGINLDPVQTVSDAINYWIENVSWKKHDMLGGPSRSDQGYSWKQVFLPHGTKIRMKYKGTMHYAAIDGDEFVYQDQPMSPSEFAKQVASGIPRNAWRDLEVRKPSDTEWHSADVLRAEATGDKTMHEHSNKFSEVPGVGSLPNSNAMPINIDDLDKLPGTGNKKIGASPTNKTWVEWITQAISELDGSASLEDIYYHIKLIRPKPFTQQWKATVRRTIEMHSSDSDNYISTYPDLFKHVGRGKWQLRNQ